MEQKLLSIREYIELLYRSDIHASNAAVLAALMFKFPEATIRMQTVYYWKCILRKAGLEIPLQRRKA